MTDFIFDAQPKPLALDHALAYAKLGIDVLPLKVGTKEPALSNGFKGASRDEDVIRDWFMAMPDAGVAMHPGPCGLLVLDVDVKAGRDGEGELQALEAMHGSLPATLTQKTPSGGRHLFFSLPFQVTVGNSSPFKSIDVRAHAGYVCVEPTMLKRDDGSTANYAFDDWDVTAGERPHVAAAPNWLLDMLDRSDGPQQSAACEPCITPASIDPRTVSELRSALNFLNADDRHTWIHAGMALKGLGQTGMELWMTWSQQSPKFEPGDAARTWRSLHPDHIAYQSVFHEAQRLGWVNPMSKAASLPSALSEHMATPLLDPGHCVVPQIVPPAFVEVPLNDLGHSPPPEQIYWWDGYVPAGVVTLFGAHGGTGKSTIAIALAVSIAAGMPLFDIPTRRGRVVYFSGEDPKEVVRRRLADICHQLNVPNALLQGSLLVLDATDGDPTLYANVSGGRSAGAKVTGTYDQLAAIVTHRDIDVVIVDNASDTFDSNEIERPRVRAFIRSLQQLVKSRNGAVLLLAHVDKSTSRNGRPENGEGYSGSTAWHNSARSRLFLSRGNGSNLRLEHQKNNLGKLREPLLLDWADGPMPIKVDANALLNKVKSLLDEHNQKLVLAMIREFYERGEFISTVLNSPTNAYKVLHGCEGFPTGLTRTALVELIRNAERQGLLKREEYKTPHRKYAERWSPTGQVLAGKGSGQIVASEGVEECEPSRQVRNVCAMSDSALMAQSPEAGAPSAPSRMGGVGGEGARAIDAELGAQAIAAAVEQKDVQGEEVRPHAITSPEHQAPLSLAKESKPPCIDHRPIDGLGAQPNDPTACATSYLQGSDGIDDLAPFLISSLAHIHTLSSHQEVD